MKTTTLSLGAPLSDTPPEPEASEVSPADAAAFLATLATAMHAMAQPLPAENAPDPFEGAPAENAEGDGAFEAVLEVAGETVVNSSGSATERLAAVNPSEATNSLSVHPSNIVAPLRYDSARSMGEYIAPALLLPSRPPLRAAPSALGSRPLEQLNSPVTLAAPAPHTAPAAAAPVAPAAPAAHAAPSAAAPVAPAAPVALAPLAPPPALAPPGAPAALAPPAAPSAPPAAITAPAAPIALEPAAAPPAITAPVLLGAAVETASGTRTPATNAAPSTEVQTPSVGPSPLGLDAEQIAPLRTARPNAAPESSAREVSPTKTSSAAAPTQAASSNGAADVLPPPPPQEPLVLPKAQEALTTPQLFQLAEASTKQDGQPLSSEGTFDDASQAPGADDSGRVDRLHGEAQAAQSPRTHQTSDEAYVPDAVELAAPNPERGDDGDAGALEHSPNNPSLSDIHLSPVNQEVSTTTSTTPQSAPEAPPSSSSRLLEHLRASFPAAEVRISEGRAGETLVSMNHPDFGAIELNLQMTSGGIDIAARVDGAIAASLLRRSEASLRKTIHRRGLSLGRLRVERNQKHSSRRAKRGIDLEA